jgi:hypothetical protein
MAVIFAVFGKFPKIKILSNFWAIFGYKWLDTDSRDVTRIRPYKHPTSFS